jgi:hypothetical protein
MDEDIEYKANLGTDHLIDFLEKRMNERLSLPLEDYKKSLRPTLPKIQPRCVSLPSLHFIYLTHLNYLVAEG